MKLRPEEKQDRRASQEAQGDVAGLSLHETGHARPSGEDEVRKVFVGDRTQERRHTSLEEAAKDDDFQLPDDSEAAEDIYDLMASVSEPLTKQVASLSLIEPSSGLGQKRRVESAQLDRV